ncbi:MAG: TolC family protein, partial [Gemmatimonadales bacterium]|nr:TolC family protein [Gemmatimonadales bacterium]
VTYLDVLRAKTLERVQQDNLRVTRSNLELSRIRQTVGTASAGEVARWESEIARSRQDVIRANSQRNLAEIALNRLLQQPVEEAFVTEETTLADASLVTSDPRFLPYLSDPLTFRHFRRFMTGEALASSPEIRQFDAAIAAQERVRRSASNAFWAPTISLQGTLSNRLAEGGAGTEVSLSLPPGSPDISGAFPRADDTNWSVGLQFSYPLYTGGARSAARSQASAELSDLRTRRHATVERIEQRVRSALHNLGASFAAIGLSQSAATAARRNLDLVTDAYGRGVVSVTDLLDAQNAALVADLGAANATYDFLIDLMQTERAAGNFDFFLTAEEREAYFERLEAFFAAIEEFR